MDFLIELVNTCVFPIAVSMYSLYTMNQNDIRNDKEKMELFQYIKESAETIRENTDVLKEVRGKL